MAALVWDANPSASTRDRVESRFQLRKTEAAGAVGSTLRFDPVSAPGDGHGCARDGASGGSVTMPAIALVVSPCATRCMGTQIEANAATRMATNLGTPNIID